MSKDTKNTLTIDVSLYQHYLDDSDMSEAEKNEFIQTMWNLVCEFVMIGFKIHPIQQGYQKCGKDEKQNIAPHALNRDVIELIDPEILDLEKSNS
jgi:hypothetical protein